MNENTNPKKRQIHVDMDTWREISHLAIDSDKTIGEIVSIAVQTLREKRSNGEASQASV